MSDIWILGTLLIIPATIFIWVVLGFLNDKGNHGEEGFPTADPEKPEELYLRYESYNHYEEGEYR